MYHYQRAYWPQANPFFAAFRRTVRPASGVPAVQPGKLARTDLQIEKDVKDELAMEPSVRDAAVDIQVSNGVLTLSGVVSSAAERCLIESAAGRIAGVSDVRVQLPVIAPDVTASDDEITHDCERVLRRLTPSADYSVGVMVSKGWVTLSGDVAQGDERRVAETEVDSLRNVHGVNSQLRVRASIARESAEADHAGGVLPGTMLSWTHHRATLYAAWSSSRAKRAFDRLRSGG